ncbi:acyl-CoA dehydrogenase family protein [uncultured Alsobacter sp.]|uniref:acyl-CoA dehydrogenase family protein n=1 Tax=uncultured Alsobacter sp. TaxID=1748258 RepID=UPI0025EC565E|nr:acyl-CoA dehydrogenase family protein [uncultured Alsobacter sp.]
MFMAPRPTPDSSTVKAAPAGPEREAAFQRMLELVAARRGEIDKLTYVPRDVVAAMKEAGIFRAATPAMFGGDALPPHVFLEMVERVSRVDGSTGWVAAFGSANTYTAALPLSAQAKMYAEGPDQVFAGGLYPLQPAQKAEGGWTVSGRWRFASGCMGADWIGVGITTPGNDASGLPIVRMAVAPAHEVEIVPNWDVIGMQGTGSHDTRVENKFYAEEWVCVRGAPGVVDEPLYRYPAMPYQAQVHAAVNLGLARAALDLAVEMSGAAKLMPGHARLADRAYFRTTLAKGEAALRAARLFYYDAAAKAWDVIAAGDELSLELRTLLRLSATHAAQTGNDIVQDCYRVCGMATIEKTNRMQQIARDAMVVIQHQSLNDATLENCGTILTGLAPPPNFPG